MICDINRRAGAHQVGSMITSSANHEPSATKVTANSTKTKTNYWQARSKHTKKLLSQTFEPSDYSVICGRSKVCFNSVGNRRFKLTVAMFKDDYKEADGNKAEKSRIVSRVLNLIREANSPVGGAFVTYEDGRWYECSERISREKIGAAFREILHETYNNKPGGGSSNKSKKKKKQLLATMKKKEKNNSTSMRTTTGKRETTPATRSDYLFCEDYYHRTFEHQKQVPQQPVLSFPAGSSGTAPTAFTTAMGLQQPEQQPCIFNASSSSSFLDDNDDDDD